MKARVVFYKTDGLAANGKYPVKLIIEHKKKRKRKTIGYSLEKHWDFSKEMPNKKHPLYFDLYAKIGNMRMVAESLELMDQTDVVKAMGYHKEL